MAEKDLITKKDPVSSVGLAAHIGNGKTALTETINLAVNNKTNVIIVDEPSTHSYDDSFELNGNRYVSINKEKEQKPRFSKMAQIASMFTPFIYESLQYSSHDRKLPQGTDIIKEYGLIQNKQSKLSRWEREQVVLLFEKNFKRI